MPELPEVEIIRRTVQPHIDGRTILHASIVEDRLPQNRTRTELEALLTGRRFEGCGRRGKYLLFSLSGGDGFLLHLRMTGQLLVISEPPVSLGPYARMALELDGGLRLELRDQRRFATLHWVEGGQFHRVPPLDRMGPEPLSPEFTAALLQERLARRHAPVKSALLNQACIAGLGNIYADEALFRARIAPVRPANSLDASEIRRLHAALVDVLREAIAMGGSSIRTYRSGQGEQGSFQTTFQVYGRTDEPCSACGEPIRRRRIAGRSTWYCEACQR